jgi:hypothetical protein
MMIIPLLLSFIACLALPELACSQSSVKLLNRHGSEVSASVLNDVRLKSLRHDLNPGIYLNGGEVVRREKEATTLFSDLSSLETIDNHPFAKKSIEMVTIQVEDASELNQFIDLTPFNSYERLKYLQVRSSVPTTTDRLHQMLKNLDGDYLLLLNVDPVN